MAVVRMAMFGMAAPGRPDRLQEHPAFRARSGPLLPDHGMHRAGVFAGLGRGVPVIGVMPVVIGGSADRNVTGRSRRDFALHGLLAPVSRGWFPK